MSILVDTSIWIDYFKGGKESAQLDFLIDENVIVINYIILAELVPYLKIKKQMKIITLLQTINCKPLNIDWAEIINIQTKCLKNGMNGIGIPDLIIAQNAKFYNDQVYTLDKHFPLISTITKLKLFN